MLAQTLVWLQPRAQALRLLRGGYRNCLVEAQLGSNEKHVFSLRKASDKKSQYL